MKKTYTVAVIDDEKDFAKYLTTTLNKYIKQKEPSASFKISVFYDSKSFYESNNYLNYDIYFLDIYIDEVTGIKIAEEIRSKNKKCDIIFTTLSLDNYRDAYRLQAMQYLEKPIDSDILYETLDRYFLKERADEDTVAFRDGRKIYNIAAKDIYYVYSDEHYKKIVTTNGCFSVRATMSEIDSLLKHDFFFKPNKTNILNVKRIQSVTSEYIIMCDGFKFNTPRGKYKELCRLMLEEMF